jgi:ABC-type dipeptide transport system, periplasmic component
MASRETGSDNNRTLERRRILKYVGAASTAVGLAGCTGSESDSSSGDTDSDSADTGNSEELPQQELYFAQVKGPLDLDPITLNDVPSDQIAGQIYDGLYEYDGGLNLQPKVAAEMPTVEREGTRFIVPLREGITFQNGDSLTADDVIHTVLAPVEEETENASEVDMVESAEKIDELTAQFDLKYPYGAFTTALARNVVNKAVRTDDREAYKDEPLGSGPFQVVDWAEEDFATLERWDDYWDADRVGLPDLARLNFDPIEESTTRVTALQTGDSDIIETIPPDLYQTVQGIDGARITEQIGVNYFYLAFNCTEGPTANPAVREAIDYAFSMDQAAESFIEPAGARQYSPIPTAMAESWDFPLEEWRNIPHDRDLDMAESLFDEAGVPSDYSWKIIVPPDDKREQIGITIGDALQNIGFSDVTVQRFDWGTFLDKYNTGSEDEYNMYTLGWSGSPDPDSFAYSLLAKADETEGVTNGTFHDYTDASDSIIQARETGDYDTRQQLYTEAITTLMEERVHLPAYGLKNSFGVQGYVDDFSAHPTSTIQLHTDNNTTSLDR